MSIQTKAVASTLVFTDYPRGYLYSCTQYISFAYQTFIENTAVLRCVPLTAVYHLLQSYQPNWLHLQLSCTCELQHWYTVCSTRAVLYVSTEATSTVGYRLANANARARAHYTASSMSQHPQEAHTEGSKEGRGTPPGAVWCVALSKAKALAHGPSRVTSNPSLNRPRSIRPRSNLLVQLQSPSYGGSPGPR